MSPGTIIGLGAIGAFLMDIIMPTTIYFLGDKWKGRKRMDKETQAKMFRAARGGRRRG